MASVLFQPIGVNPYYLLLAKALDLPLGAPQNLAASTSAGGSLAAGTYYYVVTAVDNVGGETPASNEVSILVGASGKVMLTWNPVPNAPGYNIYRGSAPGGEVQLVGSGLPTMTNAFTDTGAAQTNTFALLPNGCSATVFPAPGGGVETYFIFNTILPNSVQTGQPFTVVGASPSIFNGTFTAKTAGYITVTAIVPGLNLGNFLGGGGTLTPGTGGPLGPPLVDTTQQSALYAMPSGVSGIASYNNSNIVALFPADARPIGGNPGGGSGGGGTGGGGTGGSGGSSGGGSGAGSGLPTTAGGIVGNVSFIPQMLQFVNQMAIALGNGFPPQLYSDATGTPTNPAISVAISAISVDAFGVVTVTTAAPHGLATTQVGANVIIAGTTVAGYSQIPNAHVTLSIPDGTHVTYRDLSLIGFPPSSGGTLTVSAQPLTSTFTAAYPSWAASTTFLVGDIIQPATPNGFYYTYVQSGISGTVHPTFPTVVGQEVPDGFAILKCTGQTISGSPPPPGAAHIAVFAGSLWVWNTSPTNTSNGLDGPTCLRMSDANNPMSWNPINQAFLDKDDGTDGMGLASFTITAQGIPPEGSLVACKDFATYQILGVFGAQNFAIQRIKSDMGCLAPRTLSFIPGFGIGRYTHLGFAIFDGVDDKLISEDIRPYLFPTNDPEYTDITVVDSNWAPISWAAQTINPPMFCAAMPIGASGGALTRIFCYDLVLKAWTAPIDLPFPISTMYQARTEPSNPVTLLGSFSDGTFQRWQATDLQWATSAAGSQVGAPVAGFVWSPEIFNQFPMAPQTGQMYYHQVVARGRKVDPTAILSMQLNLQEEGFVSAFTHQFNFGTQGSYEIVAAINESLINARCMFSFSGAVEFDSFEWFVKPLATTLPVKVT